MKTVLVVSYHYPPEEGSCSEKNTRIVKKIIESGYRVIVLTKGYKGYPELNCEGQCTVIRTMNNGIFHKIQNGLDMCCPASVKPTSSIMRMIKNNVSESLVPDSIIDWVPEVKKTFAKYKEKFIEADVILSISSPYSAHLGSEYLTKKINTPYIMCYGDPWLYEPKRKRGKLRYAVEKNIEKRLLDSASKVLLITEWNRRKYHELYDIELEKILTYHIGYDESECLDITNDNKKDELNVIYGGSLDSVHRNPGPFIEAMAHVEGVKAYIYNSDNDNVSKMIQKYGVENRVILKPIIGSKAFYEELYKMDALLLFGNRTPFQVPGKVFTYISTRKGVIYIKNNNFDDDGTQMVLEEYGNSVTVNNNVYEIINCLEKMKQNQISGTTVNTEKFEFHQTMQPIVDAIKQVIG